MKGEKKCEEQKSSHESRNKAGRRQARYCTSSGTDLTVGESTPQSPGGETQALPKAVTEHRLNPWVRALQTL